MDRFGRDLDPESCIVLYNSLVKELSRDSIVDIQPNVTNFCEFLRNFLGTLTSPVSVCVSLSCHHETGNTLTKNTK